MYKEKGVASILGRPGAHYAALIGGKKKLKTLSFQSAS